MAGPNNSARHPIFSRFHQFLRRVYPQFNISDGAFLLSYSLEQMNRKIDVKRRQARCFPKPQTQILLWPSNNAVQFCKAVYCSHRRFKIRSRRRASSALRQRNQAPNFVFSKKLLWPQQKYSTFARKGLAIVTAVTHFRLFTCAAVRPAH